MQNAPSLPSLQGPLWPGVIVPDRVLSMSQIKLKCILMLNWIAWNGTVFDFETVLTQNWIDWNRTVLTFNCVWTKTIHLLNWIVLIKTLIKLNS